MTVSLKPSDLYPLITIEYEHILRHKTCTNNREDCGSNPLTPYIVKKKKMEYKWKSFYKFSDDVKTSWKTLDGVSIGKIPPFKC